MSASAPDADGFGSDFKKICHGKIPKSIDKASELVHDKLFPRQIGKDTWKVPENDFMKAMKKTEELIEGEWAGALATPYQDDHGLGQTRYSKVSKTLQLAAPPLRLIWWRTLDHIGKTPKSNEGYTLTLEEAAYICKSTDKIFTYYFLSHRWETREHPDPLGKKSAICSTYGKTRSTWLFSGKTEEVFFWIDYASIDQSNFPPFIAALPLYCSGAQLVMVPYHEEYEERGWCLVERLAYAALNGPLQFICGMDYVEYARKKGWKQVQSWFTYYSDPSDLHYSWLRPLGNPDDGKLGYETDRPMIKQLTKVLLRQWGKTWVVGRDWPPKGSFDMCSTTGQAMPVEWGKTTVNVILISKQ
eukprot:gene11971-13208_t